VDGGGRVGEVDRPAVDVFDQEIDLIIATHPDKDHIAGLVHVFDTYRVKNILRSEVSSGTSFDISLKEKIALEKNITSITARRGERIILDKKYGIYLDILFPDQDTSSFKEVNDASIVARLVYGDQSFLFTGDSPVSVEQFLAPQIIIFLILFD
jgi:competence protein ComEC